ncbi:MAG: TonB-dependent receptor plug domain-containing protein, partial [Bacteroidota bacterium]
MRIWRIVCLLSIVAPVVRGQGVANDTTRTYRLGEVVVTATRSLISVKDSPTAVEVIDLRQVQNANGNTVADVLQTYSSVFLKNYGGSAALKTVSLRGTASEHLLVLVNGNRLNSFQNGLVDFSLLPLSDVERIEIVHGGSSALYGADALGGVLNILTRQASPGMRLRAEVGVGSFGFQRYLLESQGRVGRLGLLAGYSDQRGRDDFPFHLERASLSNTTLQRANSDFQRRQVYLHGDVALDAQSVLTFSAQHVLADRGVSGSVLYPTDHARQNDKDVNLLLSYLDNHLEGVELTIRSGFHYNFETYVDPSYLINSYYKNIFVNLNPQVQILISESQRLIMGGELGRGILYGNDFDGEVRRIQKSAYVSNEFQFDFDRAMFDKVSLYQTVRYDNISDVDFAVTPKFG